MSLAKRLVSPLNNTRFLIYHGAADDHFPVTEAIKNYKDLFANLGLSSAIKEIDI